jgi:hypothetical protein
MQGSIGPSVRAFQRVWPEAHLQHIVDDTLSTDVVTTGLDESMDKRFMALADYARLSDGA